MTAKFIWLCSLQVKMMYCKLWQSFLVFHWTAAPWGCSDLQLYERPVRILFPREHPPLLFRAELNIPHLIYWSFVYHLCSISLWSRNSTVTVSACIRLKQLRLFCKSFGSLWCFLCLLIRWLWCSRTQNFCPRQASEFYVSSGYMITCIPSETHWNNEKIWHFGSQKSLFVWKFGALFCWTVSPKDSLKILLSLWIPSLELLLTICLWIYSELFLHSTWGSLGGKNTRTGSLEKVKFTSLSVLWVSLRCFDPFCSQLHTPLHSHLYLGHKDQQQPCLVLPSHAGSAALLQVQEKSQLFELCPRCAAQQWLCGCCLSHLPGCTAWTWFPKLLKKQLLGNDSCT